MKNTEERRNSIITVILMTLALVAGVLDFGPMKTGGTVKVSADTGSTAVEKKLEVRTAQELTAALADTTVSVIVVSADIVADTSISNEKSCTAIFTADRTVIIESKAGNIYTVKRSSEGGEAAKSLFEIYGNGTYDGIQVSFRNIILDGGAIWPEGSTAETRYQNYNAAYNTGVKGRAIIDVANKATLNLESGCVVQNGETTINNQTRDTEASGSSRYGGGIRIEYDDVFGGGTVNLKLGSVIQDVVSEAWGGAIGAYNYGRLNIYGGTISRCSSRQGAAIACTYRDDTDINTASTMKMYGGLVEDCYSKNNGVITIECGPECDWSEINGGTIRDCGKRALSVILNTRLKLASISSGLISIINISDEGDFTGGGYEKSHGIEKGEFATIESVETCELTFKDAESSLGSVVIAKDTSAGASFPGDLIKEGKIFAGWYDGDTKVDKDTVFNKSTVITARWHTHKWIYDITTSSDNTSATITAYCEDSDETAACVYSDAEHGVSFTVNAPATAVSSAGTPAAISADNAELSNFNLVTGLSMSVGDTVYYTASGDKTNTDEAMGGAASEGAAPETAGTYCAAVTVGNKTAYLWFKIAADEDDLAEELEIPEDLPWVKSEEFTTDIIYSDGYLHITNKSEHVRMYAYPYDLKTKERGDKVQTTYLDLSTETLTTPFKYDCYSLDNGKSWKKVNAELTGKDIGKWFSKKVTIIIADKYDSKTKKPGEGATAYLIGTVNKRPDATALKAEYARCRDPYGLTTGQWTLIGSDGKVMSLSKFEFMPLDDVSAKLCADTGLGTANIADAALSGLTQAKTFTDNGYWATWPGYGGIWVPGLGTNNKTVKAKFQYRTKATVKTDSSGNVTYVPASKVKKFTVSSTLKPTKIKADYKKETLGLKAGMSVFFGAAIPKDSSGQPNAKELGGARSLEAFEDYENRIALNLSKERAKTFSIAPYITDTRNTILVWQHATDKKPSSAVQTIVLAARGKIEEASVAIDSKGKVSLDSKKYEMYDSGKNKWVSAKNLTATEDKYIKVRMKCTAKGGKETVDYKESATGIAGTLILKSDGTKITGATLSRQTVEELEPKSE